MVASPIIPSLPKAVEYAIKSLICLAMSSGHPISAKTVARCVCIPVSQAAKTLQYLTWHGLLRSSRGSRGGYELRVSPDELSLGQVLALYQPPLRAEQNPDTDPLLRTWSETVALAQKFWQIITIGELARRTGDQWACLRCVVDSAVAPEAQGQRKGDEPEASPGLTDPKISRR